MSTPDTSPHEVTLQGDRWVFVGEFPRIVAESFRRLLAEDGVVSVLRTPFQWVIYSPVIEIETGGYQGSVGLYVPKVLEARALQLLEGDG
ncbi:hypothetical protein [Deinococcus peraridilitoris]|uniref:DUF2007 domain-containing protein n=1 Tax=Deinococcus peraridilitoris (strain DSM 19664 / LMG 22246 / CIP 109416 / KR-200) TaxID=937777 RepID=L0A1I7_DEIPD|nr:hypothetical protein [Deinococcus peraridilitoris]AFZ66875.1 hypothetical protein Deipe_1326 [Deinococcus peraridilitoris DSM 19664]